jgi:exonuclease III
MDLGSAPKTYIVHDLIRNEKLSILLLQETKMRSKDIQHTYLGTLNYWDYIVEDARGTSRGLCTV